MSALSFAVIGDPILHSKSPAMHNAAFRALGLPHTFGAIRTSADELPAIIERLRSGDLAGLSVTLPHKRRVLELVDTLDATASRSGAANALVRDGDRVRAFNTDAPAIADELRALATTTTPEMWREGTAIVLGSGGAARAAVSALTYDLGLERVVVRARAFANPDVAALHQIELAPLVREGSSVDLEPLEAGGAEHEAIAVIQATSAGMNGADDGEHLATAISWRDLPRRAVVVDVVYSPAETAFLRDARARGFRAANGLGMLARQGARAFELWLGVPAPFEAMLAAIV